jgi:zinc D-Ala-D-Ala dipeptidase
MTMPSSDARTVPVRDCGESLVDVGASAPLTVAQVTDGRLVYLRSGVVDRLVVAQILLPRDVRLLVVAGYWPMAVQRRLLERAVGEMRRAYPDATEADLRRLAERRVASPEFASHPTGAAVDLTLCAYTGVPLLVDPARPGNPTCAACVENPFDGHDDDHEEDHGDDIDTRPVTEPAAAKRTLLGEALTAVGFVNCPGRWWHWSYGDPHWALTTRAPHARYGPVPE